MKTIKITIACLMLASAVLVVSCKKSTPADSDTSGASDNSLAENTSSDIVQIGAEASDNGSGNNVTNFRLSNPDEFQSLTSCAAVSWDSITKIITVTFNGSVCLDGRVRNGSLTYNFSASAPGAFHYRDPGFSFTVTSNNYTVDGNQVNIINKTVTNTTPSDFPAGPTHTPSNTQETWTVSADINIVKASGGSVSWNCNRIKTLLNTNDSTIYRGTAIPIDWPRARVGITGSASGTRSSGETFTVNITSQLVRDFGLCRIGGKVPFILGTLTFTLSDKTYARYVDYGAPSNGACDLIASVSIDGVVFDITLP